MKIFSRGNPCEYSEKCSGYRDDSFTCTEELDKGYCGLYNRISGGDV